MSDHSTVAASMGRLHRPHRSNVASEPGAWYDELVTVTPAIKDGHLLLPTGPGWGVEVSEAAANAHPPRTG